MCELPPFPNGKPGRPKKTREREIFFSTLVSKAQTAKNSTDLVQALHKPTLETTEAA